MRTATCEFHTARVSLSEYIHSALQKPRSGDVIIGHANSPSYLLHRKFQCFISSCHNLILKTPRSCYRNLLQIIRRYLKMVGYVGYWSIDRILHETLSHLFTTRHRNLRATRITEFRLLYFIRVQLFPDRLFSTFSPFHAHSLKRLQELERYEQQVVLNSLILVRYHAHGRVHILRFSLAHARVLHDIVYEGRSTCGKCTGERDMQK